MTWYHGPRDEPVLLFEEIYIDRFYEPLEAPKNANVIDIGANIGLVTLFWTDGRTDLRFHAYEPNSEAYATLRRNVECNSHLTSQVRTFQEAVGRTRGQLELWVDVPTTLATAYGDAPVQGARKASFPMITLDDAWDRLDRAPIWMLKIDTEGAEGDILEGASDAVLASVQNACVEWHDNLVPGVYERCRKRLEDSGFTLQIRAHPWNEGIILARRGAALVGRVGALTN
jgi:FkbM family methyltransferase